MDLRQLRHVVVLARQLSFTKAAKELGITQSALTRSIQVLEQRGGVRLFDRDRAGVRLTAPGEAYAARADDLLRDAQALDRMLAQSASAQAGEAAFGIAPLPARALLPAVLADEVKSASELRTLATIDDPQVLIARVLAADLEFCVCAELEAPPPTVRSTVLGRFPISLLVRNEHPLLGDGDLVTASDYPLITSGPLQETSPVTQMIAGWLSLPPRVVVNDFGILARIARTSDAIWLSSRFAARELIADGSLAELPVREHRAFPQFRVVMYSLSKRSLSPAALHFQARFRAHIGELEN